MRQAAVTSRWVEIVADARGMLPAQVRRLLRTAHALEREAGKVLELRATASGRAAYETHEPRPKGDTLFDRLAGRAWDAAKRSEVADARRRERAIFGLDDDG